FGPRFWHRPEPRVGTTLAGVGIGLVVVGVNVLSGDHLGHNRGAAGQAPGALVCLAIVVGGYILAAVYRDGALRTVGVAATLLALPPFLFFTTFSANDVPPIPIATILFVSSAVWLVSFVYGPTRGHLLYLGAGLIAAWLWLLQATENTFTYP